MHALFYGGCPKKDKRLPKLKPLTLGFKSLHNDKNLKVKSQVKGRNTMEEMFVPFNSGQQPFSQQSFIPFWAPSARISTKVLEQSKQSINMKWVLSKGKHFFFLDNVNLYSSFFYCVASIFPLGFLLSPSEDTKKRIATIRILPFSNQTTDKII